jgi:NADH:ubiquinone oxidoreductase subunit C
MDRERQYTKSKKDIYMYPLRKDFKAIQRGEKPYKVVDPE